MSALFASLPTLNARDLHRLTAVRPVEPVKLVELAWSRSRLALTIAAMGSIATTTTMWIVVNDFITLPGWYGARKHRQNDRAINQLYAAIRIVGSLSKQMGQQRLAEGRRVTTRPG